MNSGITKKRGENPDPNSKRQMGEDKKGAKGGKCLKGRGDAKGQKGDSQPTSEAPHLTAQEFSKNKSSDSKICVLDGTNLRQLRDGLCLCSPGIVEPGTRQRKTFWKAIRNYY